LYVKNIKIKNFRNYDQLNLKLHPKTNILIGENAQGKTNLIEAIYFGCFGKSFRTNKDKDLIAMEKQFNYVKMDIQKEYTEIKIEYSIHQERNKAIKINNNSINKLSDILGNINIVLFSPEDLALVKGSPSVKRNFINRELSNLSKKYCNDLVEYNKILNHRNNLLKEMGFNNKQETMIEVFNEKLADKGAHLMLKRRDFITQLNTISNKIHKDITAGRENLSIDYLSNITLEKNDQYDKIYLRYLNTLKEKLNSEIKLGYTLSGPHRDNFKLIVNGDDVKQFGSQGQQRTTALSLKLSEIELIKQEIDEYPILLLDDVFSELDLNRQKSLLDIFDYTQTIITSTTIDDVIKENIKDYKLFQVKQGQIFSD
jgi:DNA replication and repair protein RecF